MNRIVFGTSGSNNTYTPSANTAYIVVKVIGGGGGGGGSGTGSGGSTGGTGGTSCFESASDGCSTYILKATGRRNRRRWHWALQVAAAAVVAQAALSILQAALAVAITVAVLPCLAAMAAIWRIWRRPGYYGFRK